MTGPDGMMTVPVPPYGDVVAACVLDPSSNLWTFTSEKRREEKKFPSRVSSDFYFVDLHHPFSHDVMKGSPMQYYS